MAVKKKEKKNFVPNVESASKVQTNSVSYADIQNYYSEPGTSIDSFNDTKSDQQYTLELSIDGIATGLSTETISRAIVDYYVTQFNSNTCAVVDEAIQALVESREFLGFQLAYAQGNISEEEFGKHISAYLAEKSKIATEDLSKKISTLYSVLSKPLDSETLSVMFNCEVEDIEQALSNLSTQLGIFKND